MSCVSLVTCKSPSTAASTVTLFRAPAPVLENSLQRYFTDPQLADSTLKISFKRDTADPTRFGIQALCQKLDQKTKRHKVLENCFEHCDCLYHLVEMRRQKTDSNKLVPVAMGGQQSFQKPDVEQHVKNVLEQKSKPFTPNLMPFTSKNSK
uniref:Uncharacterized protein n=1 Tax=Panagrolaimus sp. JU765 TaxID=591449 RepID=A0AC34QCG5_9BILA